jgi:alanyl-tRNA synthetase
MKVRVGSFLRGKLPFLNPIQKMLYLTKVYFRRVKLQMEQKLYYQDPYLTSFSAELIKQTKDDHDRLYAVLSKTAFYPTGGGQPSDTGTLNGVQVTEVEEADGEIRHYITQPLEETTAIEGAIDWQRRFDHMQQHSGQHILSAAFEKLFDYKTVSFHLGKDTLTIDLETDQISNEEAIKVEKLANQLILENRPIFSKWVNGDELEHYSLRKELSVSENIRLVIIPDFDYNGCGGTHPESTGQVASLKILGWERQKKKVRVEFVCGNRVLQQLGQKHSVLKQLTSLLNAPEQDMEGSVKRLLETRKELEKSVEESKERLLSYEAKEIISQSNGDLIGHVIQNRSLKELQKLARLLAIEAESKIIMLVAENEDQLQLVCARGKYAEGNMKSLVGEGLSMINGKGGGNDSFAQGGGERLMNGKQLLQHLTENLKLMNK